MVVVEVPLWVLHSNVHASTSSGLPGALTPSKSSNNLLPPPKKSLTEGADGKSNDTNPAANTTELDEDQINVSSNAGGGTVESVRALLSGRSPRSAIYTVDVHPDGSRFVTGGGDGKVRIWNAAALFAEEVLPHKTKRKAGAAKKAGEDKKKQAGGENVGSGREGEAMDVDGEGQNDAGHPSNEGEDKGDKSSSHDKPDGAASDLSAPTEADTSTKEPEKGPAQQGTEHKQARMKRPRRPAVFSKFTSSGYESSSSSSSGSGLESEGEPSSTDPPTKTNDLNSASSTNASTPASPPPPRLLCALSTHEGSVLCARWSSTGRYLATSGDDAHVLLYERRKRSATMMQNMLDTNPNDAANHENWVRIKTCRGHELDAVGLAWSPDDSHLASCSLDRDTPIIIWRLRHPSVGGGSGSVARRNQNRSWLGRGKSEHSITSSSPILQPYKILGRGVHRSVVKGLSWDPIGQYLCSSGDDPAICVWRTHGDWGLEARIDASSGIFRSAGGASRSAKLHGKPEGKQNGEGGAFSSSKPHHGDDEGDGFGSSSAPATAQLSLFRRISFAPDGSHVCGTNASLRGKNIAAMISREGWAVSSGKKGATTASGAANLVGHKQPVVVSSHCPILFSHGSRKRRFSRGDGDSMDSGGGESGESSEEDEDVEPSYSLLVALGDSRGFLTVWSTKNSRPIFKLQCSDQSRCTITDLSWSGVSRAAPKPASKLAADRAGRARQLDANGSMTLLVSMLDGHVVAIKFSLHEIGMPLDLEKRRRLFRLRYGMEIADDRSKGALAGYQVGSTGPRLIENALQYALEEEENLARSMAESSSNLDGRDGASKNASARPNQTDSASGKTVKPSANASDTKARQVVTRNKLTGKKRIRPVLVSVDENDGAEGATPFGEDSAGLFSPGDGRRAEAAASKKDPVGRALDAAEKSAAAAEGLSAKQRKRQQAQHERQQRGGAGMQGSLQGEDRFILPPGPATASVHDVVPPSTNTVFSVELARGDSLFNKRNGVIDGGGLTKDNLGSLGSPSAMEGESSGEGDAAVVADCANSSSNAAVGGTPAHATLSISQKGKVLWKDTILGRCTALSASSQFLAMGTFDGTIYFYGTCSSTGFHSGLAFRSFPPLVLGSPVSSLHLFEGGGEQTSSPAAGRKRSKEATRPTLEMLVICADGSFQVYNLQTMTLKYRGSVLPALSHMRLASRTSHYPKLVRAQLHEVMGLVIVLSLHRAVGGSMQAYTYDEKLEGWQRMADGRFAMSDCYTNLALSRRMTATSAEVAGGGVLSQLEGLVSLGTRAGLSSGSVFKSLWTEDGAKSRLTRAHCEDRMACALAVRSAFDYEHWLKLYAQHLCEERDAKHLRFLCDLLMGKQNQEQSVSDSHEKHGSADGAQKKPWWWLESSSTILGLERQSLVRGVLNEMGKSRELQRLTNEISMECESQGR